MTQKILIVKRINLSKTVNGRKKVVTFQEAELNDAGNNLRKLNNEAEWDCWDERTVNGVAIPAENLYNELSLGQGRPGRIMAFKAVQKDKSNAESYEEKTFKCAILDGFGKPIEQAAKFLYYRGYYPLDEYGNIYKGKLLNYPPYLERIAALGKEIQKKIDNKEAKLELARLYYKHGVMDEALRYIELTLKVISKKNAEPAFLSDSLFLKARILSQINRKAEALEILGKDIFLKTDNYPAQYLKFHLLYNDKKYKEALEILNLCIVHYESIEEKNYGLLVELLNHRIDLKNAMIREDEEKISGYMEKLLPF